MATPIYGGVEAIGPCGHAHPLDEVFVARDSFACPTCGICWGVRQAPPTIYPSGFIYPGKRTVYIEDQPNLAMQLSPSRSPSV